MSLACWYFPDLLCIILWKSTIIFEFTGTYLFIVHELAQGQGPSCRAVIKLLDVRVRAIEFINHGAKLAVGYENVKVRNPTSFSSSFVMILWCHSCWLMWILIHKGLQFQVAVLDMTSLSVLFLTDSVSVGSSPLVSVIAKRFMHSDGHSKSPKQSELPENHMEELMFVLTEDANIYVIDGGSGKTSSSEPLHLKKASTAISMYVIGKYIFVEKFKLFLRVSCTQFCVDLLHFRKQHPIFWYNK